MRKLILHIGAHKTGTSAIQQYLLRHKQTLFDKGWFYCERPASPTNWGHMFRIHVEPNGALISLGPIVLRRMLELMDSKPQDVIFSAEDLWFLDAANVGIFCATMAERFDQITIVAYVRRQDFMTVSHWLQGGKTVQSALIFGGSKAPLENVNPYMMRYLDYAGVVQTWQAALPKARLLLKNYDRELFPNRDVVQDFLTTTGLDLEPDGIDQDANLAFGATTVQFVYMLREAGLIQKSIRDALSAGLIEITDDKALPSREQAAKFVAKFHDSNALLASLMGKERVFSDDFTCFPQTSTVKPFDADYVARNLLALLLDATMRLDLHTASK